MTKFKSQITNNNTKMEMIRFNKNIYNLKAIEKAIEEYKNLAKFSIKEKGSYIEVALAQVDKEVKNVIKDEFANYVLGLMS